MRQSLLLSLLILPAASAADQECSQQDTADAQKSIIFEQTDWNLGVRTLIVTQTDNDLDQGGTQRSLVITDASDTSVPCTLNWWLQHNVQGMGVCTNKSTSMGGQACAGHPCDALPDAVFNGYARTMLAAAVYAPPAGGFDSFLQLRARKATRQLASEPSSWTPRAPNRLLVIGLGTSTMPLWIRHHMPDTKLDVAEIVPGVAAAAPCFGLDVNSDKLQIHVADGRKYLEEADDSSFDAVLIDAYDSKLSLPPCLKSRQFFESVHRKVVPGGALAFNLLSSVQDSARVLKSVRAAFGGDASFYKGDAPGAEGVQEVVVAVKPWAEGGMGTTDHSSSGADAAATWLKGANFRPLEARGDQEALGPLEDKEVCPQAAGNATSS